MINRHRLLAILGTSVCTVAGRADNVEIVILADPDMQGIVDPDITRTIEAYGSYGGRRRNGGPVCKQPRPSNNHPRSFRR